MGRKKKKGEKRVLGGSLHTHKQFHAFVVAPVNEEEKQLLLLLPHSSSSCFFRPKQSVSCTGGQYGQVKIDRTTHYEQKKPVISPNMDKFLEP